MAEELLRQKVYKRVNQLRSENPGESNMALLEVVRQEMGFDKLSSVSANYYRAKAEDPDAPAPKRGRPRGAKKRAGEPATHAGTSRKPSRPSRSKGSRSEPAAKGAGSGPKRSASAAARASRPVAGATEASQAMDVLSGLVAENQRLLRENEDLRDRLAQVSRLAAV